MKSEARTGGLLPPPCEGKLILRRVDAITQVCAACCVSRDQRRRHAATAQNPSGDCGAARPNEQFSKQNHIFDYFWEKANSSVHVSVHNSYKCKHEQKPCDSFGYISSDSFGIPIGYYEVFLYV